MKTIKEELSQYIEDTYFVNFGEGGLAGDTDLFEAGIFDSFGMVNFSLFIEQSFNVEISPEAALNGDLTTLDSAVSYIETQKKQVD